MSRIIAGVAGGQHLAPVPGTATRPTADRVKEALFSRLDAWDVLAGARVVDLFSGSGALGVECVSRGAASAILVDNARVAIQAMRQNAALVNEVTNTEAAVVRPTKVGAFLESYTGPSFTLALLDPPYPLGEDELAGVLAALVPHLDHDAVVCVERSFSTPAPTWPDGIEPLKPRRYGETTLHFAETPVG